MKIWNIYEYYAAVNTYKLCIKDVRAYYVGVSCHINDENDISTTKYITLSGSPAINVFSSIRKTTSHPRPSI
jgi:hypothetical protein